MPPNITMGFKNEDMNIFQDGVDISLIIAKHLFISAKH